MIFLLDIEAENSVLLGKFYFYVNFFLSLARAVSAWFSKHATHYSHPFFPVPNGYNSLTTFAVGDKSSTERSLVHLIDSGLTGHATNVLARIDCFTPTSLLQPHLKGESSTLRLQHAQ